MYVFGFAHLSAGPGRIKKSNVHAEPSLGLLTLFLNSESLGCWHWGGFTLFSSSNEVITNFICCVWFATNVFFQTCNRSNLLVVFRIPLVYRELQTEHIYFVTCFLPSFFFCKFFQLSFPLKSCCLSVCFRVWERKREIEGQREKGKESECWGGSWHTDTEVRG